MFKRERLASTCMQILFDCAHGSISDQGDNEQMVSCAAVVVARRFRHILQRLQIDSDAAGICPLPKYRISQVRVQRGPSEQRDAHCFRAQSSRAVQVALMVQLLTDGGPPAQVSTAIIDMLSSGAAGSDSGSLLMSADLIQRAGKHAMLLFVYVVTSTNIYAAPSPCLRHPPSHCVSARIPLPPLALHRRVVSAAPLPHKLQAA